MLLAASPWQGRSWWQQYPECWQSQHVQTAQCSLSENGVFHRNIVDHSALNQTRSSDSFDFHPCWCNVELFCFEDADMF